MKKLLVISFLFVGILASVQAQRRINPAKQIYTAPDSTMILYSDENSELQFRYLEDLLPPIFSADQDTVTLLPDGRYVLIDEGRRDTIDTRANSNQVTTKITVDGQVFNAGDVVQDILIALSRRKSIGCNVTINQNDHGFPVGTLVSQDTNGVYFLANSAVADSFPVAMVCNVIDANTFQTSVTGRVAWTHGLTPYRDYWLLNDGSVGLIPGANPVFAFRTVKSDSVDIDIPENVFVGQVGTGDQWGSQVIVSDGTLSGDGTESSPLGVIHDKDWLNGAGDAPSDINENIYTMGYVAIGGPIRPHNLFVFCPPGENAVRFGTSNYQNDLNFVKTVSGMWVKNGNDFSTNYSAIFFGGDVDDDPPTNGYLNFYADGTQVMRLINGKLILDNVPNYATDAAADADGTLITGSVYTVTAEDRTLRIKP